MLKKPSLTVPISVPYAYGWIQTEKSARDRATNFLFTKKAGEMAVDSLLNALRPDVFPELRGERFMGVERFLDTEEVSNGLIWKRDDLGKPFVEFVGELKKLAEQNGISDKYLHISNTNDGGAHVVLAVYGENIAGVGVDLVDLSRLRRPSKDIAYFKRFARQFMSEQELAYFLEACELLNSATRPNESLLNLFSDTNSTSQEEAILLLSAAHFSLMESASKACGTGLKMGVGMGHSESLPKQSLGFNLNSSPIKLLADEVSHARMKALGAVGNEVAFQYDASFMLSAVLLMRESALPSLKS